MAAVQSLDGRTWDSLDGGEYGLVGADTFMHQARYAIALHDAEVDVLVSKVPWGGCRGKSLASPRAMVRKTERRK